MAVRNGRCRSIGLNAGQGTRGIWEWPGVSSLMRLCAAVVSRMRDRAAEVLDPGPGFLRVRVPLLLQPLEPRIMLSGAAGLTPEEQMEGTPLLNSSSDSVVSSAALGLGPKGFQIHEIAEIGLSSNPSTQVYYDAMDLYGTGANDLVLYAPGPAEDSEDLRQGALLVWSYARGTSAELLAPDVLGTEYDSDVRHGYADIDADGDIDIVGPAGDPAAPELRA